MKYAKYILILALLAASGACTKDFEDYNTNPNKQSEGSVAPIALLEPLIYSSTNSYSSYMLSIANEISQVTVAKSTPRREHCYNLADGISRPSGTSGTNGPAMPSTCTTWPWRRTSPTSRPSA